MNPASKAKSILAGALMGCCVNAANAEDVHFGFLASYSGATKPLAESMADAMQLAMREINNKGGIAGGQNAVLVSVNSGCTSKDRAVRAAERLIGAESAVSIVGGLCSGVTLAAAQGFTIPTGTLLISPASVSPTLSGLDDKDLVFRTIKSSASSKGALPTMVHEDGISRVTVLHSGSQGAVSEFEVLKQLLGKNEEARIAEFTVTPEAFELSDEVYTNLAVAGGNIVVIGDGVETEKLSSLILELANSDFVQKVYTNASNIEVKFLGDLSVAASRKLKLLVNGPTKDEKADGKFNAMLENAGLDADTPLLAQTYDAAFLLALAHEKYTVDGQGTLSTALRDVANGPGEVIGPQDWARAVKLISQGKAIDYEGASGPIEFDQNGDLVTTFGRAAIKNGQLMQIDMVN